MYYPTLLKLLRLLFVVFICIFALSAYFVAIWILFVFSHYLDKEINGYNENKDGEVYNKKDVNSTLDFFYFPVTLPALSNVILINIFEDVFNQLSTKLTVYENH